jgi:hypothetical protein
MENVIEWVGIFSFLVAGGISGILVMVLVIMAAENIAIRRRMKKWKKDRS